MADQLDAVFSQIMAGRVAGTCETPTLDFKEDSGSVNSLDTTVAKAAICFANAAGGDIVVGVSDKKSGPAAFPGTRFDAAHLRQRVFELTNPPLLVEVIERHIPARLLIVHVNPGATVHADTSGRSWQRINTSCLPLQPADQARLAQERAGYDWSSEASTQSLDAASDALLWARDLLNRLPDERRLLARQSDADLLRSLGVVADSGSLNRAGELLFCSDSSQHLITYQYKLTPGGEPRSVQRLHQPMVLAFLKLMESVVARQSTTPVAMPNGQQILLEDFPAIAVREALSNALCHRDWQVHGPVMMDHSPEMFSVTSPGPLVAGVTPENILTIPSRPRNRRLSAAIRLLGLAEETGRGVDRMFREAIRSGRQPPSIEAFPDRVRVAFIGGAPDTNIARFVARLPESERDDTDTMLLLHHLCRYQTVTALQAAPLLQRPVQEAAAVLRRLSTEPVALLEPTRQSMTRSKPIYRLREDVIRGLGAAVVYNRRTLDEIDRKIIEHIREYGNITNRTLQNMFDVHVYKARDILSALQLRSIISKVSESSRGSKVKWGPGTKFPKFRERKKGLNVLPQEDPFSPTQTEDHLKQDELPFDPSYHSK